MRAVFRAWVGVASLAGAAALAAPLEGSSVPSAGMPVGLISTADDFAALQQEAAARAVLLRRCERDLTAQPQPRADMNPGPHYSAEGVVENPVSRQFSRDAGIAYRAALCARLAGDDRLAAQARRYLDAWSGTLRQVSSEQGRSEVNFLGPQLVLAAALLGSDEGWQAARFRRWAVEVLLPCSHAERKNNHANWGLLLEASIAALRQDGPALDRLRERWIRLLASQVAPDGSLPLEVCRSDTNNYCGGPTKGINGLSYTHYTLLPATVTAQILAIQGREVWQSAGGRELARAYAQAAAWTTDPASFPYYAANAGRLNGVRNAAYFAVLQRHWPDPNAAQVLGAAPQGADPFELRLLFGTAAP